MSDFATAGLYDNMPEVDYHGDQGSLSQSGIKTLLKSPALFAWEREHPSEPTLAMTFGSAVHSMVLGHGAPVVVIPPTSRAKADQEAHRTAKAEAASRGAIGLAPDDYSTAVEIACAVNSHPLASKLLDGRHEVSAFAPDEATGVMRRARFDAVGTTWLADLKTTTAVTVDELAKTCATYDYALQAAYYTDVARDLGLTVDAFGFVFVSSKPPHTVTVAQIDENDLDTGRARYRRGLGIYADCVAAGVWPGPVPDDEFVTLTLPRWYAA